MKRCQNISVQEKSWFLNLAYERAWRNFHKTYLKASNLKKYLVCSKMSTVTVNHINMCKWHFAVVAGWGGDKLNCFRYNQVSFVSSGVRTLQKGAPDKSERPWSDKWGQNEETTKFCYRNLFTFLGVFLNICLFVKYWIILPLSALKSSLNETLTEV